MDILNIVDKARALESRIARALTRAAGNAVDGGESGEPAAREPLEIAHAIVDVVYRQVQPGSRGSRLFPFNRVTISVLAPGRESRLRFEALFTTVPSLTDRILDRLRTAGCDVAGLRIETAYVARAGRQWDDPQFSVAFDRVDVEPAAPEPPPPAPAPARLEITVLRGEAERGTYLFTLPRVDFGRGVEVRDDRQQLLRTNHVVFVEGTAGANQTVSRRHAHIAVDEAGEHRLHDDRSVHGTGIVRGGRTIPVPPGARGVRLRDGDEIVLGEARIQLRLPRM